MDSDSGESAHQTTSLGLRTLLVGCLSLLAGLALAGNGLLTLLSGEPDYDQSDTWLGIFIAVGGGQILATCALTARGIQEFDFWQARTVLPATPPHDRLLVWLQIPFQCGALLGVALYVMLSPGGYLPGYLLALSIAATFICWNTFRVQASAGPQISLYLLAAAMVVRFLRVAAG